MVLNACFGLFLIAFQWFSASNRTLFGSKVPLPVNTCLILYRIGFGEIATKQGIEIFHSVGDWRRHMRGSHAVLVLAIVLCAGVASCAGDDAGAGNSSAHSAQGSSVHHRQ